MKHLFLTAVLTAALAACGGKKAPATTPGNTGGSAMESTGATGGKTYGDAPAPGGGGAPMGDGAGADPCAGGE